MENDMLKSDQHKKLNKLQQKFLVNILSGGLKDIKYCHNSNLDYDGRYHLDFTTDIEINLDGSDDSVERIFFHELFHMWFHLHMDEYYRKKIIEALEKEVIYDDTDSEEVLAVHFTKWICKKLLDMDYKTEDYDYGLIESSMPKKVIKLFNKIYKEVKSLI